MLFNNKTVINSFIMFLAGSAITANAQQEATAPEDSDVIRLTTETFPDFIKENSLVLAEFFAPWCGHCKNLAPEYVSAASELKKYDIPLAQIDCTVESDLCMEHGIKGYPSLKIFRGVDLPPSDYEGARNKDSIINYMKKQALPSVQVVEDEQDLKDLISEATEVVIVDTGVENLNETFHKAANLYRDYFTFLQQSPSNNTEKGVLSLYHPGSNNSDPIVFTGKNTTLDHIVEWISIESKPYFGEVDGSTFESYMDSGIPLAYFFYTTPEERESYSELFTTLGKEYRGKINFAALDASKYGRHATNLNMKEQFPLFVIHDINTNYKYGLEQLSDEEFANLKKEGKVNIQLEEKEIQKFVTDFENGKLEPIIKSEEIPEVQETNVTKIVGKSHDAIVHDSTKDVLVKYYAPWCGHCKRLAPIYEELANIYAFDEDASSKVVIGEVDSTENDIFDIEIASFPTIVLYPAAKDAEPVIYSGSRNIESFIEFIKENGANGVDGDEILTKKIQAEKEEEEEKETTADEEVEEVELDEL